MSSNSAVSTYLRDLLRRQPASGFADFPGAVVTGTLPLTEQVLNDIVAETVLKKNGPIKRFHVAVLPANRLVLDLTIEKWLFTPQFQVTLDVDKMVNFPADPVLRLRLAHVEGPFAGLVEPVLNIIVPDGTGVRVSGRLIEIDLGALLRKGGQGYLIPLVKLLHLSTKQGRAEIDFALKVDEPTTP